MLSALLDMIFPPACEVCRRQGDEAICPACFSQIKFIKPQFGIYCVSTYEGELRTALHRFKFEKRKRLAEPLGILLVKYLSCVPDFDIKEIDCLVPVPLHEKRYRQRGYNQVELLAQVVSRYHEVPVVSALERMNDTRPQFELDREARLTNVKGAFRVVDHKAIYNKRVLLLDDIYTTGSTIGECGKALKTAGAKRVEVAALSRAC